MAPVIVEYLNDHDIYTEKYGKKTIVLTLVGSFYECYCTKTRGPNLHEISNMVNIIVTRKDKSNPIVSIDNPYMSGFPMVSVQKFITLFVNNGFTVVIKDQIIENGKIIRKVTNIISSGTYVENVKTDSNNIVCIYLEQEIQKNGRHLLCSGMSAIDVSTGKTIVHEAVSSQYDEKMAIDEANRFINTINPTELIIYTSDGSVPDALQLDNFNVVLKTSLPKKMDIPSNQNIVLAKIYKTVGMLTPIESLDLENVSYARTSFIALLEFIYSHNEYILNKIEKPVHFINNKHMLLGNNAIQQLNVIAYENHTGIRSLFDVVNNTSTAMGHRMLKENIVSPFIDSKQLNAIYDYTDIFIKKNLYTAIEANLNCITDIERSYRKIIMSTLGPSELLYLTTSLCEATKIYNILIKEFPHESFMPSKDTLTKLTNLSLYSLNMFNQVELAKYSFSNFTGAIHNIGIYKDIDKYRNQIQSGNDLYNDLCQILNEYMADTKSKSKICVKKNDRDGNYLVLSKPRLEMLKKNLQNVESIKIKDVDIKIADLIYDTNNKNCAKILLPVSDITDEDSQKLIVELSKKYFIENLKHIANEFGDAIYDINKFIAYVDFIKSNAKSAVKNNYKKPIIDTNIAGDSYVKCKQLRHPIIERIIDYEYVPHDIAIGQDIKGVLLYGINSSGKSSIMKAIGLSIIMAQAGLYVPASDFTFRPYSMLYTRITGDDNLFKGQSSFVVEMLELKAIMTRANSSALVIGDEICRGTEVISANAIVAATIIKLNKLKSSFVFATHLHEIATMKCITELKNVKAFHISVQIDPKTHSIVYDRLLKEGHGESIYGVIVAKHIIHDFDFIENAEKIKNDLLKSYDGISSGVKSRYNASVVVDECRLCGKQNKQMHISELESHHINQQKDCVNGFVLDKPHIKKNSSANLAILCASCHDALHSGSYSIYGYKMTSNGKALHVKKDGVEAYV